MSKQQIANYFAVSRTPKTVPKQKRIVDDSDLELSVAKKAAHARFAHLTEKPCVTSADNEASADVSVTAVSPAPSVLKIKKARPTTVRSKAKKIYDTSKQATINWSPLPREQHTAYSVESNHKHIKPQDSTVTTLASPVAHESTDEILPSESRSLPTANKALRPAKKAQRTNRIKVKCDENLVIKPPMAPASPRKALPAFERFVHLVEPPKPTVSEEHTELGISVTDAKSSAETDFVQTEVKVPSGLPLPFELRVLLELFRSCDTIVSMLHNRQELCSFDKLKPAVQEVVRKNFEESHVGQFVTVYPRVYNLHYEKQLDKFTRRPTNGYVLVLSPNLRTDGTQMGHDSPSKGHLVFTGTRLIQRRNRFHRLLVGIVMRAHRDFLKTLPGVNAAELPDDTELRRWHPKFNLDSMVPPIKPSPLPIKPSDSEHKITTAKDAVRAFQARALFREAEACQNVVASRLHNTLPSIPSPTKASACSPRKLLAAAANSASTNAQSPMPSVALFSSSSPLPTAPVPSSPMSVHLKGVSETLLAKVRARENERRLLTQLTQSSIPESRRAMYARLPSLLPQVWTVMRTSNGRPMPMTTVASRIAGGFNGGLSTASIVDHLNLVLELCPLWIEKLNWTAPHLKILAPQCSVKEILDSIKEKLAKEGYQL